MLFLRTPPRADVLAAIVVTGSAISCNQPLLTLFACLLVTGFTTWRWDAHRRARAPDAPILIKARVLFWLYLCAVATVFALPLRLALWGFEKELYILAAHLLAIGGLAFVIGGQAISRFVNREWGPTVP